MSPSSSIPDRKTPPQKPIRLDVEDDNARQRRIQSLLESIESSRPASAGPSPPPLLPRDDERPRPLPRSSLISRAEDFLPRIAAANAVLAAAADADPAAVNVEHLEDPAGPHIEMNLGLGVFTQRNGASDGEDDGGGDSTDDDGSRSGCDPESDGCGDGTSTSSGSSTTSSISAGSSTSSSASSSTTSSTRSRARSPPTTTTISPPSAHQL